MRHRGLLFAALLTIFVGACADSGGRQDAEAQAVESCMLCHNGSKLTDYAGPGLENPHPFAGASNLTCTICHGGNPDGLGKSDSHVPPPPEIGDRQNLEIDDHAYFNRLTRAGIDKFPAYQVDGTTYTAIDYLQFIAPSDLRVVTTGRSCGQCHSGHVDNVSKSLLATEAGILSGAAYAVGLPNAVPANDGLHLDTAADYAVRDVADSTFDDTVPGVVGSLIEYPVYSRRFNHGPDDIRNNAAYDNPNLDIGMTNPATEQIIAGTPLAKLYHEQIAFTCGDCHLGSSGANNRYGDFRGSGCAACHMRHALSGRSTSGDPNLNRMEPYDPDDIEEPETPHVGRHLIRSVAQTLPSGEFVTGIDDYACAGCHQGSNRTVMQYWGIRLDQNQDVVRGFQYPIQPFSRRTTSGDRRLFDPDLIIYNEQGVEIDRGNDTFNGRNRNQYLLEEDYDNDQRDDTPPDVHYEAGMGCIDCHGSYDLHGGEADGPGSGKIVSRMEQHVGIRCESCHGSVESYASVSTGTAFDGQTSELAQDAKGNALKHVRLEPDGNYYLYSRLTGARHFIPQTRDTVVNSGRMNPLNGSQIYSTKASYAMGTDDGDDITTGIGPRQSGPASGFTHMENMDCASCHASWTNTCMGCHLKGEYRNGNEYSNITGEEIVFEEDEAEFIYQSPVFMQLGVNSRNKITQTSSNTKMFFQWEDRANRLSRIFNFSDRRGLGNQPGVQYPSLGHNAMMAHSIRGKVNDQYEGPRYCVACHLTTEGVSQYGAMYASFKSAMANNQFDQLVFSDLQLHFGRNPGNRLNSPLFVHMAAGLGTGLFLFDAKGGAINPLDQNDNRYGIFADADQNVTVAPATAFDPATFMTRVAFNLDRVVTEEGIPTGSSNHPMLNPGQGPDLRDNSGDSDYAGPLGRRIINRLTNPDPAQGGIVLDGWLDANGDPHGTAPGAPPPPQTADE